jgi:integrase
MARKRYLPDYVSSFTSQSGRTRLRFRRKGFHSYYFASAVGTEDFRIEYRKCLDGVQPEPVSRYAPGTIGDLFFRYAASPTRLGPTKVTRAKVNSILERFVREHGARTVAGIEFEHVDAILAKRSQKVLVGKRMEGGIDAARKLRKELVHMFAFAVKARMRSDNPILNSDKIRVAAGERGKGFHSWSEDEIEQFRKAHKLGTKPRLAMELLLWSGQRRGDVHLFGDHNIVNGRIEMRQLREAIEAMPPRPHDATAFMLTAYGKPFSNAGFGNWFREQCDKAGLPHCTAHGLRKAIMRRAAELEMGNQSLKSLSGHSKDDEVSLYTAAASQQRMADSALNQISEWEVSHLAKIGDNTVPKSG